MIFKSYRLLPILLPLQTLPMRLGPVAGGRRGKVVEVGTTVGKEEGKAKRELTSVQQQTIYGRYSTERACCFILF